MPTDDDADRDRVRHAADAINARGLVNLTNGDTTDPERARLIDEVTTWLATGRDRLRFLATIHSENIDGRHITGNGACDACDAEWEPPELPTILRDAE